MSSPTPETAGSPPRSTPDDGWSAPSVFGRGLTAGPAMSAYPEPEPGLLFEDDRPSLFEELVAPPTADDDRWGAPTYVGRRRHRPTVPATHLDGVQERIDGSVPVGRRADTATDTATEPATDGPPAAAMSATRPDATPAAAPSLLASSRTMAIASLASRLTGFMRNIVLVAALGSAGVADAYNSANSFPNMVYELLLGGVLSSVLIPLLVHAQEHDDDGGDAYAQRLLSIATAFLGATTLFAVALAPYLTAVFVDAGPQRDLTSVFATLLLPEIFFYGLGAVYTAVLNTRHVYGIGAWAPVINNVIVLSTVIVFELLPGPATLTPSTMTTAQILVIGIGTTLGIIGQAMILLPALGRAGFHWQWRFRGRPQEKGRLGEAGSLAGWVLGYVAASQAGVTVVLKVANDHHGVTTFTNADLLFQMPYGILGVSLLTALMPRMSRAAARHDTAAVVDDLALGARLSAIALVPITAGLIVLGPAFTTIFFAHGQTTIAGARQFGVNLALAAFGLLPFAIVMLQLRVFYAMRDGRTPTLINAFMVGVQDPHHRHQRPDDVVAARRRGPERRDVGVLRGRSDRRARPAHPPLRAPRLRPGRTDGRPARDRVGRRRSGRLGGRPRHRLRIRDRSRGGTRRCRRRRHRGPRRHGHRVLAARDSRGPSTARVRPRTATARAGRGISVPLKSLYRDHLRIEDP